MRDHVFISDLDGTLLQQDATLSNSSRLVLQRVIDAGVAFSVASARSVTSIRSVLRGLSLRLPVIEFNGAFVSDLETGRHLVVNALSASVAAGVFECMAGRLGTPIVSSFDGTSDHVYHEAPHNEGVANYLAKRKAAQDPRLRKVADAGSYLHEQVVCLTSINRLEALELLQLEISSRFKDRIQMHLYEDAYKSGWFWLTVHAANASKDRAVKTLLELSGMAGRRVTAFGDNVNDITLLRSAHNAVAVSNAVDDLKALAHEVIGSAAEEAVPRYISRVAGLE
jgi:Cof subfamily protein (haloacid dehalogenase superfamily)